MTDNALDDAVLRRLLARPATVACVGASPDPVRPSHFVARYLQRRGYRVIAVHPRHAGTEMFGTTCVADLTAISEPVDLLDVFRRSEAVPALVEEALAALPGLRGVWLQLGVTSPEARAMCAAAGVAFVEDRCPKIELQRLSRELGMAGIATGALSSRLPRT